MISLFNLFEIGQQSYNMLGEYVKNKRQEVNNQRQLGNKQGAVFAAKKIDRALDVRQKLAGNIK